MTSQVKSKPAPLYELTYSRTVFVFEILLNVFLLLSIVQLISGAWAVLFILLLVLISIRFFQTQSIITQFNQAMIEIRFNPDKLIWYDQDGSRLFTEKEIKIITSRWFILLQLGQGHLRMNRLLLSDSFVDNSHYTRLRRQLNEINTC